MIDFLLGLGLTALLILANFIVVELCKLFPKNILGMVPVMIGLDSIMTIGYTFIVKTFTDNIQLFIGGIGLSIVIALTHKVFYMLRTFKIMFKDEIGK
tara:strand:+ start:14 stop:307 length:294 start_codon:yes stop_codon:yes gene_type:complete